MKNSNENLMGGTWLLTFLQHQNALFYYHNPKNFSCNPHRRKLFRSFRGLFVNSFTFAFILTCHKKPGRNAVLCTTSALGFFPKMTLTPNNNKFIFYCK